MTVTAGISSTSEMNGSFGGTVVINIVSSVSDSGALTSSKLWNHISPEYRTTSMMEHPDV